MKNANGQGLSQSEIDVLVVNTYEKSGGAARAAYRIFTEVRNRYRQVHYLTLTKEDPSPDISGRIHRSPLGIIVRALTRLDGIPLYLYPNTQRGTFSPNFWPNPFRVRLARFRPKLVHLHWVGVGLLGMDELAHVRCPIVWTLHDAWAFTGGCHYTKDCEGFKTLCGCCPQLGSNREHDYSRYLMRKKTRIFQSLDLTIVTPSRWLAEMARQSSLLAGRRIEVIPNGLDTERFQPITRQLARSHLGIRTEGPVLLFGAQVVTDPRKGWDLLCAAVRNLKRPCTLLVFGSGGIGVEHASHITVHQLGNIKDDATLAFAYSAADVYVCPSREDNLPNTVAEALACGTPCAAFGVNGLPDMIEHKKNGWLAKPFDVVDLAEGIRWLVEHPQPEDLRRAAREKATTEYSMGVMGDRYMALYEEVWAAARAQTVHGKAIPV